MVTPSGNELGALFVIVGFESLLSVAVAVPMFTIVNSSVDSNVIFSGAVIVGGVLSGVVVSCTVTVLVLVTALFPELSAQSYLTWYDCIVDVSMVVLSILAEIIPSMLSVQTAPSSVYPCIVLYSLRSISS